MVRETTHPAAGFRPHGIMASWPPFDDIQTANSEGCEGLGSTGWKQGVPEKYGEKPSEKSENQKKVFLKIGGKHPKMDGENHGKTPMFLMDDGTGVTCDPTYRSPATLPP